MTADGELRLVADIGGTNARFALAAGGRQPEQVRVLRCADYPSLEDALAAYLAQVAARPRRAAMAVATPLTGDQVRMTNHVWSFSIAEVRRRLDLDELLLLNDFTALALAVPHLTPAQRRRVGGRAPVEGATIGVIGPGTGLGTSGLVPAGDRYIPLQSEGGHVTFGATDARELAIREVLARRLGHVSVERLVSGPGLVNLYQAIASIDGEPAEPLTPPEVSERGLAGRCAICREALDTFCRLLGTVAGNLVLTLGARGGLYIGGGIVPRLGAYFDRSPFRPSFEYRGRFSDYVAAVPCYVILAEYPALIGAADAFAHPPHEVGIAARR